RARSESFRARTGSCITRRITTERSSQLTEEKVVQPFVLTSDIASLESENTRVINVPATLSNKDSLLSWYARTLGMPQYFGANWAACDECLRDLSRIKDRRLALYHRGVPLEASPTDQRIYIEVLANAVRDWKPGEEHEIVAAFDPAC